MKAVTKPFYEKLINEVAHRYGLESKQALMFARLVESNESNKMMIMITYNKLINKK